MFRGPLKNSNRAKFASKLTDDLLDWAQRVASSTNLRLVGLVTLFTAGSVPAAAVKLIEGIVAVAAASVWLKNLRRSGWSVHRKARKRGTAAIVGESLRLVTITMHLIAVDSYLARARGQFHQTLTKPCTVWPTSSLRRVYRQRPCQTPADSPPHHSRGTCQVSAGRLQPAHAGPRGGCSHRPTGRSR